MRQNLRSEVENIIRVCLRKKLLVYTPESTNMPFHYRLLGRDRMALFSFIHSFSTSFGTSIFEPVAVALARERFVRAEKQYALGKEIYAACQRAIQDIITNLSIAPRPDKTRELRILREHLNGDFRELKTVRADLFLEDKNGVRYLFDIKSPKPNSNEFKRFKQTLLEWAGIEMTARPDVTVNTFIAIPYNPYEPEPYKRWTMAGMIDVGAELKVAAEFWDFIGGDGAYEELLDCFERVGVQMRDEIDERFKEFVKMGTASTVRC
ncbi:MAG: TdeIII family type II restriction endonuclease [Synergistaceae bacterium]|jgi:type II restriction enzyme|nr:TdeIII family type II restriction endonuclease [Synergistaceae bacterium]